MKILENIESLGAKASIIWLMGQYFRFFPTISQDVLRSLSQTFASETEEVKLQILNFACKLYAAKIANENTERTTGIISHIISLASFDESYTVREKARLFKSLLFNEINENDASGSKVKAQILEVMLNSNLEAIYGPGMNRKKVEEQAKEFPANKFHIHSISFVVLFTNLKY